MNVHIAARTELGPVEMFKMAVEHGATVILDLRHKPGAVPAPLNHIYQHPATWVSLRFAERFFAHWPCNSTCDDERVRACECPNVLLLTDDGEAATAVDFIRRVRPQARSLDGLW